MSKAKPAKRKPSTALVAAPPPLPAFVRDDEMMQGHPEVTANAMMARVQEQLRMGAYMAADVAAGTMTPRKLQHFCAAQTQSAMIIANMGLSLQADMKRLDEVRAEERNIVLLANKSGDALKLLRIILSTMGSDWAFHRMNDETGVMARVPMGKLIGDLLMQQEIVPVNEGNEAVKVADALSESERQRRTDEARVKAAGGVYRTQEQVAADEREMGRG